MKFSELSLALGLLLLSVGCGGVAPLAPPADPATPPEPGTWYIDILDPQNGVTSGPFDYPLVFVYQITADHAGPLVGGLTPTGVKVQLPSYPDANAAWLGKYQLDRIWITGPPLKGFASRSTLTISLSVTTTSGDPSFFWQTQSYNTCSEIPATTRPTFKTFSGNGSQLTSFQGCYEWWADKAYYILEPGETTLSVSLNDPSVWSDTYGVFGNLESDKFEWAKENVQALGLSFGGGCAFGHGVSTVGGTATIEITSLEAN